MSTFTPCAEPAAPPVHLSSRLLIAVDIEGYGGRTSRIQVQMRAALLRAMESAARGAGLDRDRWLRQDSGDGELAVLPVDVDVFTAVGRFAPALERALAAMREDAGEAGPLRVRLALHYGTLIMDSAAFGPSGDAPVVVVEGLLDARPLRRHLTVRPDRNVALIVSDMVFRDVVCSGLCVLPPAHFYSARSTIRGTVYPCHIYDPDGEADENSRGGEPLTAGASPARSGADEPFDEGADLYQRVLEQAQHNPPGYDVEAELGRLTDWMSAPQRPGVDVAAEDENGPSSAPGSLRSPEPGFWGRLTETEQATLIASAVEVVYPAGTVVWSEGQSADEAVVIRSGLVRVSVNRNGQERVIAVRGPGDIIGERAALLLRRRSATVVAMDTVRGLRMTTPQFAAYLGDHPRVVAIVESEMYDRLTEQAHDAAPGDHIRRTVPGSGAPTAGAPPEDEYSALSTNEPTSPMAISPPGLSAPPWAGQNCTIAFVDIAGFSAAHRNDRDRLEMRRTMYALLREALEESGVPWHRCHIEDRGDGALIVVPPEVPTATVVDPMIAALAGRLRRHNQRSSSAVHIQLRVAVDVGPVMSDPPGVTGFALIHTARLLDARPLKDRLTATGADLGFIASQFVYESVITHGAGYVNPAEYERISYRVKTFMTEGWIALFGIANTD